MAIFTLKRYSRDVPEVNAGKLTGEWAVKARDVKEAVASSRKLLANFNPSEHFAILWNDDGKAVWETGETSDIL